MRELLSNNSRFVGQLYEDISLNNSLLELIFFLNNVKTCQWYRVSDIIMVIFSCKFGGQSFIYFW